MNDNQKSKYISCCELTKMLTGYMKLLEKQKLEDVKTGLDLIWECLNKEGKLCSNCYQDEKEK